MGGMHDTGILLVRDPNFFTFHFASNTFLPARSLKNHGVDTQPMWEIGETTMALPLDEKMKFEQGDSGNSFG
jgi:hypothetical protein